MCGYRDYYEKDDAKRADEDADEKANKALEKVNQALAGQIPEEEEVAQGSGEKPKEVVAAAYEDES